MVGFEIFLLGGRGMIKSQGDISRKLRVLSYTQQIPNISKTCRHFSISRQSYYEWKQAYAERGEEGLRDRKRV